MTKISHSQIYDDQFLIAGKTNSKRSNWCLMKAVRNKIQKQFALVR